MMDGEEKHEMRRFFWHPFVSRSVSPSPQLLIWSDFTPQTNPPKKKRERRLREVFGVRREVSIPHSQQSSTQCDGRYFSYPLFFFPLCKIFVVRWICGEWSLFERLSDRKKISLEPLHSILLSYHPNYNAHNPLEPSFTVWQGISKSHSWGKHTLSQTTTEALVDQVRERCDHSLTTVWRLCSCSMTTSDHVGLSFIELGNLFNIFINTADKSLLKTAGSSGLLIVRFCDCVRAGNYQIVLDTGTPGPYLATPVQSHSYLKKIINWPQDGGFSHVILNTLYYILLVTKGLKPRN